MVEHPTPDRKVACSIHVRVTVLTDYRVVINGRHSQSALLVTLEISQAYGCAALICVVHNL